ncbi:MAG: 2-hydroxyacyl-CoA dehydratase subunit D [Thermodesulfobacteriota bacterium]
MIDTFLQTAKAQENPYLSRWQEKGGKVVGYTCSYVPQEILYAGGILPFRIRASQSEKTNIGDTYFGPFICSLPKCMLQLAGEGVYSFLDGAIITAGCDSMRRLHECWRKAGQDIPGSLPEFFFHLGVPHKASTYAVKWFEEELDRLINGLQDQFKISVSRQDILESISIYNQSRELIQRLEEERQSANPPISGAEALAIYTTASSVPRQDFIDLLSGFLEQKPDTSKFRDKKRLMLIGSANDDLDLIQLIEGERAVVVADQNCFGAKSELGRIGEDGDPLSALAERYLQKFYCPRMYGQYKNRRQAVLDTVRNAGIDGVVLQNIRFCDLHGAENGLLERDLEDAGIPCLKLEREYGLLVETGRIKMRVDAFMERLEQ